MERTRPLSASTTTTDPLYCPSDSTAARRISRSSPSMLSPSVESAYVGLVHGPPAMIGGAGTPTFSSSPVITRAGIRDATDSAGLTSRFSGAFTWRLAGAAACAALARRCLCLMGTVAAKPVAARRWTDKVKAIIRDAMARNDLIIIELPPTTYRWNRGGSLARADAAVFDRSSRILNSVHWNLGPSSEFFYIVPFRTFFARNSQPRNSKQRDPIL